MNRYKHLLSQLAMPILAAAAAGAIAATLIGGSWPKTLINKAKSLPSAAANSVSRLFSSNSSTPDSLLPTPNSYSAVYLTGGKVYFGILDNPGAAEPVLKDVFYLTLGQARDEFRLNKLTGEDNPKNELVLSRDHILYWEPLAADSKVIQGIDEFHKNIKN